MSEDRFGEIILFLDEILFYVRAIAAEYFKEKAQAVINSYEKAQVYSLLDGKHSQCKIEEILNIPQRTISDWVSLFVGNGLVAPPTNYRKFHKALFTLKELGINVSKLSGKRKGKEGAGGQAFAEEVQKNV
jgi:hypothetical protein